MGRWRIEPRSCIETRSQTRTGGALQVRHRSEWKTPRPCPKTLSNRCSSCTYAWRITPSTTWYTCRVHSGGASGAHSAKGRGKYWVKYSELKHRKCGRAKDKTIKLQFSDFPGHRCAFPIILGVCITHTVVPLSGIPYFAPSRRVVVVNPLTVQQATNNTFLPSV